MPRLMVRSTLALLLVTGLLLQSGCQILGALASKLPLKDLPPVYTGMAGQNISTMIWLDQGTLIDWPTLQLDLANSINVKLKAAQKEKVKELEGSTFTISPASIIRYQREHAGIEALPINEVAPRLGVSRLIYVEVENFSTRSDTSLALYLGQMEANIRVVEVTAGKGKIAFQKSVRVQYPEKSTKEGELNKDDRTMYVGTVDAMSTEIATMFITHPDPE